MLGGPGHGETTRGDAAVASILLVQRPVEDCIESLTHARQGAEGLEGFYFVCDVL